MFKRFLVLIAMGLLLASCSLRRNIITPTYYPYHVMSYVAPGYTQEGIASWYGPDFHGRKTADGEVYNMYAHTAASKTLPFNTIVRVINLDNGRQTVVRINDRGPFIRNRVIDLSYAAAKDLGMIGPGTAPVKIVVLGNYKNNYIISHTDYFAKKSKEKVNSHQDIENPGYFAVQIASFRSLYNALKYKDRMLHFIKGLYIYRVIINSKVFYRVLVGSFSSKNDALDYAEKYVAPVVSEYCISKK